MADRGFKDLDCYRLALEVFVEAYAVTKRLPAVERYNLCDQLRRAATSATLNIAEGYGRYHYLDKARFYYMARGSLTESLAAFVACQAAGYTDDAQLQRQRGLCHRALQALNGLIRYTNSRQQGQREYGDRALHDTAVEYDILSSQQPEFPSSESPNSESTDPGSTDPESTIPGG